MKFNIKYPTEKGGIQMPTIKDEKAEMEGVLAVAKAMAVAARTAPKARGVDAIETLIVFGKDLDALAQAMEAHGKNSNMSDLFKRDAGNVRKSHAVLLVGIKDLRPKKMDQPLDCGACGNIDCAGFLRTEKKDGKDFPGPVCMFQAMDLGIALSSACALAARFHIDNRMMYTNGGPARKLGWMQSSIIIGIPLSCTGKNIYFDRP
jgi:uncharacterized ferredoxin-like protein